MKRFQLCATTAVAGVLLMQLQAMAGGHTWRVNEYFTNADGTIQFIELTECCGFSTEYAVSTVTSDANLINLGGGLTGDTAGAKLLLATTGFAALPGAPTPDYIIADNFFAVAGDTVAYSVYNHLGPATLPTDGHLSRQWDGVNGSFASTPTYNSPTNYAGQTGFVSARCSPSDVDGDGQVGVLDFLDILSTWGPCASACPQDSDLDGTVGILDFLDTLANWGSCP